MRRAHVAARTLHRVVGAQHPHEAGALQPARDHALRVRRKQQRMERPLPHVRHVRRGRRRHRRLLLHVPRVPRIRGHVQALRRPRADLCRRAAHVHGLPRPPRALHVRLAARVHGAQQEHRRCGGDGRRRFGNHHFLRVPQLVGALQDSRAERRLRHEEHLGIRRPHAPRDTLLLRQEARVHARPRPAHRAGARHRAVPRPRGRAARAGHRLGVLALPRAR